MNIAQDILLALERRETAAVRELLSRHPYLLNFEVPYGWPLLHRCFGDSVNPPLVDLSLVELFIANGGDVTLRTPSGVSLLFLASMNYAAKDIADYLRACGGRMSAFEQGVVALIREEDEDLVLTTMSRLLEECPDLAREIGDNGLTLLHHAIRHFRYRAARLLLDRGGDANAISCTGSTPLGLCPATEDARELRQLLIGRGARPTARERLLELIRTDEDDELMNSFQRDPPLVNSWLPNFGPILHAAVRYGKGRVVAYLLTHGAYVNVPNEQGRTALFFSGPSAELARILLQHKADVNARDSMGCTPLHIAVSNSAEVVELLIEHGADVNAETRDGLTPLDLVSAERVSDYKRVAQYLRDRGARCGERH